MTQRESILVSACLLGEACRYDGKSVPCESVKALAERFELVPICPEVLGGLPTPRIPSEIQPDGRVVDKEGVDRTGAFSAGAQAAVDIAREYGCTRAILKSRSPSCGVDGVYDGTFSGVLIPGQGVAAAALREAGVQLSDEMSFYERFSLNASATSSVKPTSHVKRIVVTGGPCAGKTSAMEILRSRFARCGIRAIFVPEAATDLIMSGVAPWTCASMLEFQTAVVALQLEREAAALEQAASGSDVVVICDRGICDSHAYLTDDEYAEALIANGLDERAALARYDVVFHLESISKGDPAAYTRANNEARFEDAAEAVLADERTAAAWSSHSAYRFIGYEADFNTKANKLSDCIFQII